MTNGIFDIDDGVIIQSNGDPSSDYERGTPESEMDTIIQSIDSDNRCAPYHICSTLGYGHDKYTSDNTGRSSRELRSDPSKRPSEIQYGGDHYKKYPIQPAKFHHVNGLGYLQGAAIDYIVRYRDKGGRLDLEKAIHCIELIIEFEYEGEKDETTDSTSSYPIG